MKTFYELLKVIKPLLTKVSTILSESNNNNNRTIELQYNSATNYKNNKSINNNYNQNTKLSNIGLPEDYFVFCV